MTKCIPQSRYADEPRAWKVELAATRWTVNCLILVKEPMNLQLACSSMKKT